MKPFGHDKPSDRLHERIGHFVSRTVSARTGRAGQDD